MAVSVLPNGEYAEVVIDYSTQAYTNGAAITSGTPFTAGRAILYVCTTSGTMTVTLSSGNTMAIPITAGSGIQTLPVSATEIVLSGGAAGSFFNVS